MPDQKLDAFVAANPELKLDADAIKLFLKSGGGGSDLQTPQQIGAAVELMRLYARSGRIRESLRVGANLKATGKEDASIVFADASLPKPLVAPDARVIARSGNTVIYADLARRTSS